MEELGVKAGDSVSYYARATDNDAVTGAKQTSSDIYFLRIRPFDKNFKPAASMGGGGGGGGGGAGQEVGALSQQQRQIISGTFNIQRDRKTMAAAKVREGIVVLTLAQSKLRDQVNGLVERMNSRLVVSDPSFKKIAELLPKAEQRTRGEAAASPEGRGGVPPGILRCSSSAAREFELQVQPAASGGGVCRGAGSIRERSRRRVQMKWTYGATILDIRGLAPSRPDHDSLKTEGAGPPRSRRSAPACRWTIRRSTGGDLHAPSRAA